MLKHNLRYKLDREELPPEEVMKSVRIFEKDGMIHMDYRINDDYRTSSKVRTRFSTGIGYSKRTMIRLEKEKYQRAFTHWLKDVTTEDPNGLKVDDIALDAIHEGRHERQADTQRDYLSIYEMFIKPTLGQRVLREIKVLDIKRWKDELLTMANLSQNRYSKYHRCLNFIFQYALENEIIEKNVVTLVDRKSKLFHKKKNRLDNKYYTAAEVTLMLENATGWFRVMLLVYLNTGMRSGEGLALKWSDINFERRSITIQRSIRKWVLKESTKTGEDRVVLMSKPLKEALLAYRKIALSDTWLFPNPTTRKPYGESRTVSNRYFEPLLKRCNIEYRTFYALRHTFASLSAQKNIPMTTISKQLGHKNISTTTLFYIKNNLIMDEKNIHAFDHLYS